MCKINIIESSILLKSHEKEIFYGIRVLLDDFIYENRCVSCERDCVTALVNLISENNIASVHIDDVVQDFISYCQNN